MVVVGWPPIRMASVEKLDLDEPHAGAWPRDHLATRLHRLEMQPDGFANEALDLSPGPARMLAWRASLASPRNWSMRAPAWRSIAAGHSRPIFSLLRCPKPIPAAHAGGPMTELATNVLYYGWSR
jgi:hypothetical protein